MDRWAAGYPSDDRAALADKAKKAAERGEKADDETAIKVTDGAVEVISEGHWRLFT